MKRRFLLGVLVGMLIVPAGALTYLNFGHPPVAVDDTPLPYEKRLVRGPLRARIDREMPREVPVAADEATLPLCPFGESVTAAAAARLAAAVSAPMATRRAGRLLPPATTVG